MHWRRPERRTPIQQIQCTPKWSSTRIKITWTGKVVGNAPSGRLQIFLALRSSGRVEIFCPEGRWVSSKSPEGQKISTLPLDRSAKKISSRPKGQKWSLWTTKPNLRDKTIRVPTQGTPNLLGFLEIMKKLNCQRQTKSAKKISRGRKKPGSDAKRVQKFSPAIFLYTSAR